MSKTDKPAARKAPAKIIAGPDQPGGSFIIGKDGKAQPNLDDEAMADRKRMADEAAAAPAPAAPPEVKS